VAEANTGLKDFNYQEVDEQGNRTHNDFGMGRLYQARGKSTRRMFTLGDSER
jgi:hypothetical protein